MYASEAEGALAMGRALFSETGPDGPLLAVPGGGGTVEVVGLGLAEGWQREPLERAVDDPTHAGSWPADYARMAAADPSSARRVVGLAEASGLVAEWRPVTMALTAALLVASPPAERADGLPVAPAAPHVDPFDSFPSAAWAVVSSGTLRLAEAHDGSINDDPDDPVPDGLTSVDGTLLEWGPMGWSEVEGGCIGYPSRDDFVREQLGFDPAVPSPDVAEVSTRAFDAVAYMEDGWEAWLSAVLDQVPSARGRELGLVPRQLRGRVTAWAARNGDVDEVASRMAGGPAPEASLAWANLAQMAGDALAEAVGPGGPRTITRAADLLAGPVRATVTVAIEVSCDAAGLAESWRPSCSVRLPGGEGEAAAPEPDDPATTASELSALLRESLERAVGSVLARSLDAAEREGLATPAMAEVESPGWWALPTVATDRGRDDTCRETREWMP